jgi:potassium-dependent mechanosensitive channel
MKNYQKSFLVMLFSLGLGLISQGLMAKTTNVELSNMSNAQNLQATFELLTITTKKNAVDKAHLEALKREKQKTLSALKADDVTQDMIDKAQVEVFVANANLDAIGLSQAEASQMVDSIQLKINNLEEQLQNITLAAGQTSSVKNRIENLQKSLNFERSLLKSQQKLVDELTSSKQIAKQIVLVLDNYQNTLVFKYSLKQKQEKQMFLQEKEIKLQAEQKNWLNQLSRLNKKLENLNADDDEFLMKQHSLEVDVLVAQEQSNLTHLQIVLLNMQSQMAGLKQQMRNQMPTVNLNNNLNQATAIQEELMNVIDLTERKIDLLEKRGQLEKTLMNKGVDSQAVYEEHEEIITGLLTNYQNNLNDLNGFNEQVKAYIEACQIQLTKALSRRQGLPGFSVVEWEQFGHELLKMPILAIQATNALKDQLVYAYTRLTLTAIMIIIAIEVLWLWVWVMLRNLIIKSIENISQQKQTIRNNIIHIFLRLVYRNLVGIFVLTAVSVLFWLSGLPVKSFAPIIYLAIVWFTFKFAVGLARLTLMENIADAFGKDVILYKELKWAFWAGGLLTMLTVLAHQLPVSFQVTDFFNRLFMLFLLMTTIVLLRGWQVVPALLEPYIDHKHLYLMRVVKLLSFLIPFTVLSTAIIGILGYVDLAWAISRYEGVFLLVLSGYIIARGFLKDIMDSLSELFIGKLRNGWVWTQAVLRPLDKVFRIFLFLLALYILFYIYGWTGESPVVAKIKTILSFHLVDAKGLVITPMSIIEIFIAGGIIYWLSRWTRELSYRFMFAKTRDVGLRNSLAVLTQYMMFMTSFFISLKVIGIDLSGISYVLAGFAAGVGLGLRDLIKNYASGLLLLFERPIRTGDLVTIGNYEGEVTHLGMRAITVKTWDHMEVLVPNSDTFEKPVTNWTHLDSIIRTVIELKVSREDDPFLVQRIILEALKSLPAVVSDPEPQVYFKEMSESLLCFEVRYYVNLQSVGSRPAVRSEVLFKIFSIFKEYNIRAPHPVQDVILHRETDDE